MKPKYMFFTTGVGTHNEKLASFEMALRDAGIAPFNLVYVSSIFPPKCKIVSRKEGLKRLQAGQILYCVLSRNVTREPNRLASAAIGLALPKDQNSYGYISEHHAFGMTAKKTGEYAEDLAATMLASTKGIQLDPDKHWNERKEVFEASGKIFKTTHYTQSAEGNKDGKWTTVIAAAVMIMD